MKKIISSTVLYLAFVLLACQDGKEDNGSDVHSVSFYRTIGHQIPTETGIQWINTYNQKNNINGRTLLSPYSISATTLSAEMSSVSDLVGFAFHHAIDDAGVHHFIVIPIDQTLSVWGPVQGKVYIDANTDTPISETDAIRWTNEYKQENPSAIWFHFFGRNVFDEISAISYFDTLNIVPAINDLDLTPQLLLIVTQDSLLDILGRSKTNETTVYDASSPCPPCPVN